MHISEGVLSAPVLVSGFVFTAAGTAIGLRKLDLNRIPQVALLAAGFFVASLIHVPIPPASTHLILTGLLGVFLGWISFPAILIGLILQAVLFQFGGITTLGINTLNMALPALICFFLFHKGVKSENVPLSIISSFLCGAGAIFMSGLMVAISLALTGKQFYTVSKLIIGAHIPVMIIEGLITVFCVRFFKRVKPEVLEVVYDVPKDRIP